MGKAGRLVTIGKWVRLVVTGNGSKRGKARNRLVVMGNGSKRGKDSNMDKVGR